MAMQGWPGLFGKADEYTNIHSVAQTSTKPDYVSVLLEWSAVLLSAGVSSPGGGCGVASTVAKEDETGASMAMSVSCITSFASSVLGFELAGWAAASVFWRLTSTPLVGLTDSDCATGLLPAAAALGTAG